MFSFMKGDEKNIAQGLPLFFIQLVSPLSKWVSGYFFLATLFISDSLCDSNMLLALFMFVEQWVFDIFYPI